MAATVRYGSDKCEASTAATVDRPAEAKSAGQMTALFQTAIGHTHGNEAIPAAVRAPSVKIKNGDAALLLRISAGDRRAAQLLLDQYLGRIVAYSYRMLGDGAEAEDVAQETFLRLWRNIDTWRADAPLIHFGCTGSPITSASTGCAGVDRYRWTSYPNPSIHPRTLPEPCIGWNLPARLRPPSGNCRNVNGRRSSSCIRRG